MSQFYFGKLFLKTNRNFLVIRKILVPMHLLQPPPQGDKKEEESDGWRRTPYRFDWLLNARASGGHSSMDG